MKWGWQWPAVMCAAAGTATARFQTGHDPKGHPVIATAPSFFAERDAVRDTRAARGFGVDLQAPHYVRCGNECAMGPFEADAIVKRSQERSLRTRQSPPSSNNSQSSTSNPNDKSQSLGYLDNSYYVPLNVSTDSTQMIFVSLDTGSSDLWFVSTSCTTSQCSDDRILKFNPETSATFRLLEVSSNSNVSVSSSSNSTHQSSSGNNGRETRSSARRSEGLSKSILSTVTNDTLAKKRDTMQGSNHDRVLVGDTSQAGNKTVPFSLQYDDTTSASGSLGVDSVAIADEAISNQVFGLVATTNVSLAQQGISGVLGMGFARGSAIARSLLGQDVSNAVIAPLLTSILSSKQVSYPFFSLSLNSDDGRLTLGAAEASILTDTRARNLVEWYDVMPFPSGNNAEASNATANIEAERLGQYVYWALPASAAGFGGSSIDMKPTYSQVGSQPLALIDSGTAGILGPYSAVSAMFNQIDGARHVGGGRYVVPCDTQERMFFAFGGRDYTLLPSDYIIGPASGNPYLCFAWPAAVAGGSDGIDWTLGQTFLRTVYSLFSLGIADREAPKIGFYPLRSQADETASASIFAPEASAAVASFVSQATAVLTTLPNSLVPLPSPTTTQPYYFSNATTTVSAGLVPSQGTELSDNIPPSTFRPVLTASTGDSDLPVLDSQSSALPLPSNPASTPLPSSSNAANMLQPPSTTPFVALASLATAGFLILSSSLLHRIH